MTDEQIRERARELLQIPTMCLNGRGHHCSGCALHNRESIIEAAIKLALSERDAATAEQPHVPYFKEPLAYLERLKQTPVAASSAEGPRQVTFDEFWARTNNSNYFSIREIDIATLKQVASEAWNAAKAQLSAAQPSPDAESSIERQIAICEQNGAKWCNFAVADVKRLLIRPDAAKVDEITTIINGLIEEAKLAHNKTHTVNCICDRAKRLLESL